MRWHAHTPLGAGSIQGSHTLVDLLQAFQLFRAEGGEAALASQVGGELFDELGERPAAPGRGQDRFVVDASVALAERSSCSWINRSR